MGHYLPATGGGVHARTVGAIVLRAMSLHSLAGLRM
jgi:hypothetical protein